MHQFLFFNTNKEQVGVKDVTHGHFIWLKDHFIAQNIVKMGKIAGGDFRPKTQ